MYNTASGGYSLKIMTVVVIILLPVVLLYQGWTYYVFRRRVSKQQFQPQPPSPAPAPSGAAVGSPDRAQPSAPGPAA